MSSLLDRLSSDLKDAMRAGDTVRREEIRGLIAALNGERQTKLTRELNRNGLILRDESATLSPEQTAEVERLQRELSLSEAEEQAVLQQRLKQHRQSLEWFEKGDRRDLLEHERAQVAVLESYLPAQLSAGEVEEAIQAAVRDTGAQGQRDQGKVMGLLSSKLRGRADMKQVSTRVQQLLDGRA